MSTARVILVVAIAIGVVLSVMDYRDWKRAETANFGKGSAETAAYKAAQKLVGPYVNEVVKMRFRYPDGWEVIEDPRFKMLDARNKFNFSDGGRYEIVKLKDQFGRATVTVSVQADNRDLINIADEEAVGMTEDREYLTVNGANMTVLTWNPSVGSASSPQVRQLVLAKKNGGLFRMEVICEKTSWETLAKTFGEIYKSWVLI